MTLYVISILTIDNNGENNIFNCVNVQVLSKAYDNLSDAMEAREEVREADLYTFKDIWSEEDNYIIEKEDGMYGKLELNVYYNGDVVNSTIYEICEVDYYND